MNNLRPLMRYRGWNLREKKFYKTSTRLSFFHKSFPMNTTDRFEDIPEGSLLYVVERHPHGQTTINGELIVLHRVLVICGETIGWVAPLPHTYFIRQDTE